MVHNIQLLVMIPVFFMSNDFFEVKFLYSETLTKVTTNLKHNRCVNQGGQS